MWLVAVPLVAHNCVACGATVLLQQCVQGPPQCWRAVTGRSWHSSCSICVCWDCDSSDASGVASGCDCGMLPSEIRLTAVTCTDHLSHDISRQLAQLATLAHASIELQGIMEACDTASWSGCWLTGANCALAVVWCSTAEQSQRIIESDGTHAAVRWVHMLLQLSNGNSVLRQ